MYRTESRKSFKVRIATREVHKIRSGESTVKFPHHAVWVKELYRVERVSLNVGFYSYPNSKVGPHGHFFHLTSKLICKN